MKQNPYAKDAKVPQSSWDIAAFQTRQPWWMLLVHPEYHQVPFSYCMKPAEYQQYMAEISPWIEKNWLVNVVEEQKTEISLEIELTSVNLEEFLASLQTLIIGQFGW